MRNNCRKKEKKIVFCDKRCKKESAYPDRKNGWMEAKYNGKIDVWREKTLAESMRRCGGTVLRSAPDRSLFDCEHILDRIIMLFAVHCNMKTHFSTFFFYIDPQKNDKRDKGFADDRADSVLTVKLRTI